MLQIAFSAGLDDSSSPSCVDIFPKLICGPCGAPNLPRLLMMPIPNRSRSLNTHPLIDDFVRKLCGGAPVLWASLRTKDKQTLLAQGLRSLRWSQQQSFFHPKMTHVMSSYQGFNARFRFTSLALYICGRWNVFINLWHVKFLPWFCSKKIYLQNERCTV